MLRPELLSSSAAAAVVSGGLLLHALCCCCYKSSCCVASAAAGGQSNSAVVRFLMAFIFSPHTTRDGNRESRAEKSVCYLGAYLMTIIAPIT